MMLLNHIVELLVTGSIGTAGTDIVKGAMAEEPVNQVAVNQYGGDDPIRKNGPSLTEPHMERPRFQVMVRDAVQETAWNRLRACRDLLAEFDGPVGGTTYHNIVQIGDIQEITQAGDLSYRVVLSFEAWKDPS